MFRYSLQLQFYFTFILCDLRTYSFRVHICVTLNHTKSGVVENFLRELNMACEDLVSNPEFSQQSRTAAVYGQYYFKKKFVLTSEVIDSLLLSKRSSSIL